MGPDLRRSLHYEVSTLMCPVKLSINTRYIFPFYCIVLMEAACRTIYSEVNIHFNQCRLAINVYTSYPEGGLMKRTKGFVIVLSIMVLIFGLAVESVADDQSRERSGQSYQNWNYCPYCGNRVRPGYGMGPGMMSPGYGHGMIGGNYRNDGRMMGPGMMGGYGPGYGMGPGMMQGYGSRWGSDRYENLSERQRDQLEEMQEEFYRETRPLRDKIRDEQYDMNRELDKANPDDQKLKEIQQELSKLRSEYDQKMMAHNIEVRKIIKQQDTDAE